MLEYLTRFPISNKLPVRINSTALFLNTLRPLPSVTLRICAPNKGNVSFKIDARRIVVKDWRFDKSTTSGAIAPPIGDIILSSGLGTLIRGWTFLSVVIPENALRYESIQFAGNFNPLTTEMNPKCDLRKNDFSFVLYITIKMWLKSAILVELF